MKHPTVATTSVPTKPMHVAWTSLRRIGGYPHMCPQAHKRQPYVVILVISSTHT